MRAALEPLGAKLKAIPGFLRLNAIKLDTGAVAVFSACATVTHGFVK